MQISNNLYETQLQGTIYDVIQLILRRFWTDPVHRLHIFSINESSAMSLS